MILTYPTIGFVLQPASWCVSIDTFPSASPPDRSERWVKGMIPIGRSVSFRLSVSKEIVQSLLNKMVSSLQLPRVS